MPFEVEYTDEFEQWWNTLDEAGQATVDAYVRMLEEFGVALGFPYSSDIKGSEYSQMRELRPQHKGKPYRVLYPSRSAKDGNFADWRRQNRKPPLGANNSFRWQIAFIGSISKLWKRRTEKMAKSFKNLRDKMSPASKKLSAELAGDLRDEIRLTELRNALGINQEELGELLNKKQAAISRLERRSDMHVSTLREFIKALGGKLEIIARFPDASYHIKQFEQE